MIIYFLFSDNGTNVIKCISRYRRVFLTRYIHYITEKWECQSLFNLTPIKGEQIRAFLWKNLTAKSFFRPFLAFFGLNEQKRLSQTLNLRQPLGSEILFFRLFRFYNRPFIKEDSYKEQ